MTGVSHSDSDAPRPEEEPDSAEVTASTPGAPAEPEEPETDPVAGSSGSGNRKVLFISAAAVVVLVVAGVVVYLLTRDDSSTTAGGPEVPSIENSDSPSSVGPARPPGGVTATITAPSTSQAPPAAGGEAGAAQDVAEQAAEAITASDLKTLGELSCDPDAVDPADDTFPADAKVEVVGNPQVNGDTATVDVKVMIADAPPATVPMPLVKKDGRWCILN